MNNGLEGALKILLVFMIVILVILLFVFILLKLKERNSNKEKTETKSDLTGKGTSSKGKISTEYTKQSIFSFMEFEKIEDNMIVKKEGKTYLMVVECQGINYDLMSGLEKTSVEEGFLQFLNTLRHPIQLYIQTRTVNLGKSLDTYKEKVKEVREKLVKVEMDFQQKVNSMQYTREQLSKFNFEVMKQRNLYEYGLDIVRNTEQMSLNKNILTKKYYVILPYYSEEAENKDFSKEEIKNIAFSELYTKSQSIISSLFVCGINSKILDSTELTELLYVAYNRDESETYELNKVLNSGYEELYSTAEDVLDKKMEELDKKIEEDAIRKANEIVFKVTEEKEKERQVRKKEEQLDSLIDDMAKIIIDQNRVFLGSDVTKRAKEKIDSGKNTEGGAKDGKK